LACQLSFEKYNTLCLLAAAEWVATQAEKQAFAIDD
jgi:hypothetical protein